jgi:hypothetical protein
MRKSGKKISFHHGDTEGTEKIKKQKMKNQEFGFFCDSVVIRIVC